MEYNLIPSLVSMYILRAYLVRSTTILDPKAYGVGQIETKKKKFNGEIVISKTK